MSTFALSWNLPVGVIWGLANSQLSESYEGKNYKKYRKPLGKGRNCSNGILNHIFPTSRSKALGQFLFCGELGAPRVGRWPLEFRWTKIGHFIQARRLCLGKEAATPFPTEPGEAAAGAGAANLKRSRTAMALIYITYLCSFFHGILMDLVFVMYFSPMACFFSSGLASFLRPHVLHKAILLSQWGNMAKRVIWLLHAFA